MITFSQLCWGLSKSIHSFSRELQNFPSIPKIPNPHPDPKILPSSQSSRIIPKSRTQPNKIRIPNPQNPFFSGEVHKWGDYSRAASVELGQVEDCEGGTSAVVRGRIRQGERSARGEGGEFSFQILLEVSKCKHLSLSISLSLSLFRNQTPKLTNVKYLD